MNVVTASATDVTATATDVDAKAKGDFKNMLGSLWHFKRYLFLKITHV